MKIIIKINTIMMYIMVVLNRRLMLEGQIWKITLKSPAHEDHNKDQHCHHVHHGRVELDADVGGTNMEDHAEEALQMKIIIKTNKNHDVQNGCVELQADVGETDMADHTEEALHLKILIKTNTIMMYIMVMSNWRLMLEG
jgi:hypothetical protein